MKYRLKFDGVDTAISREAGESSDDRLLALARGKWELPGVRRVRRTVVGGETTIELIPVAAPHRVKGVAGNLAGVPREMLTLPLRSHAPLLADRLTLTCVVITEAGRPLHHYAEPGESRRALVIDDEGRFYQYVEGVGRDALYAEIPKDEALNAFDGGGAV